MANGKIKQGNAAVSAPRKAPKKATGNAKPAKGKTAPNTAKGVTVGRRDAAGKF